MEYNSALQDLALPEYGRGIQKMVDHVKSIEDKELRNKAARSLIEIMGNKHPHLRDVEDFNHKLWDHLFIMAEYELDVDSPYPIPEPSEQKRPQEVSYGNQGTIKYKYYGSAIAKFIDEACKMEEGPEKEAFIETIANLMKKFYLNYNRDNVEDEVINEHLVHLSGGQLRIKEEYQITSTSEILSKNRRRKRPNKSNRKKKHQKNN